MHAFTRGRRLARAARYAVVLLPFVLAGCTLLENLGQQRPAASSKIRLDAADGPLLIGSRDIGNFTCGKNVRMCTQLGSSEYSCQCVRAR